MYLFFNIQINLRSFIEIFTVNYLEFLVISALRELPKLFSLILVTLEQEILIGSRQSSKFETWWQSSYPDFNIRGCIAPGILSIFVDNA